MSDSNAAVAAPSAKPEWLATPTQKLVTIALLVALGTILSFLEIPIMAFLKYDPASVMALLCGFVVGPLWGCVAGALIAVLHAFVTGNWWGAVVNIVVTASFVLPAALAFKFSSKLPVQIIGLVVSCLLMIVVAIVMNVVIYPILGTPVNAVVAMIVPLLLPFNIVKGVLNAVLAFALLKGLTPLLNRMSR
jgi:riboflavin transporter FmnP